MEAQKEGDIYWITLPESDGDLRSAWPVLEKEFPEGHWVLIWKAEDMSEEDLEFLEDKTEEYGGSQRAVVLMNDQLDYDKVPDTVNLAPSRQEAIDLIDMEKMQWDLDS